MCGVIQLRLIFLIFLLIFDAQTKQAKQQAVDKTQIELADYEFDIVNKDLFKQFNYYLPSKRHIYTDFVLNRNITEFGIKLTFDVIKKDKRTMNLMKFDIDGCKYLESAYAKVTAILVAMKELFKRSNLPHKCPIIANKLYYIKNYTVNAKDYPDMIPAMDWQVGMKFFIGKRYQGQMRIKGEVRKF